MGAPNILKTSPSICLPISSVLFLFIISLTLTPSLLTVANAERILQTKEVAYTKWNQNVTYISSTDYNARGMGPLYNATHKVIEWFIGDVIVPPDYIIISEQSFKLGPKVENNEWGDLLKQYWPILMIITLTALLVVFMPIIGLCFCCCRCAGACGGRSQPFDKKHDTCRRVFLGFLLIGVATALLFGVVVAYVTNSYMQEGIDEVTTTARYGMDDTKLFLDSTSAHIDHLLIQNYKELNHHLDEMLKSTPEIVYNELEKRSKAISLSNLTTLVEKLPDIKDDLEKIKSITNELRVYASQLSDGLRGVKRELLKSLTKCTSEACKEVLVKYEIGKLDANGIDYNQLPDMSAIIDNVDSLLTDKILETISKSKDVLKNLRTDLKNEIDRNIPSVTAALKKAGQAIESASKEITEKFHRISDITGNHTKSGTELADKYINEYSKYRLYSGVAISSVLLLVLVCITLALFCGICGKRPDGYGDDCCNKGSGSRFLMLGVAIIFLTISVLAAISLAYFLVGIVLQRFICVPLMNPENDEILNYVDNYLNISNVLYLNNKKSYTRLSKGLHDVKPDFKIVDIIRECHNNQSIYEVLRMNNYFDIREILEYPDDFKINSTLQVLIDSIKIDANIEIIDEKAEEKIKLLGSSQLGNFAAYKFIDNLKDDITNHSLREIAEKLKETAKNISSKSEMPEVLVSLQNQALHLETYQDKLVEPMTKQTKQLLNLAKHLEASLRHNDIPFEETIDTLLEEIKLAQEFIKHEGTQFVKNFAEELIQEFRSETNRYLIMVVNSIQNDVGTCMPLSRVYSSLVIAGCNKIVDPFNGFWAGVGWCVLIFLPTIIISVKLSTLYQKSDPYPGPLVESEYLYDAYSERDNIPLANGPKNKRRKTKERRRSRDRRGDYYEDSGSSHGGAPSSGRDTRYNDMAPKHWDGGPPRYQNAPMAPPASEYERPPPYYYPGAPTEQD